MSKLLVGLLNFGVSALTLPITKAITEPMFKQAVSQQGHHDFWVPQMIGYCGLAVGLACYFYGAIFSASYIRSLPDEFHARFAMLTALILIAVPTALFLVYGSFGTLDYGLVMIGFGLVVALPFLIWAFVAVWRGMTEPYA